MNIGKSGPCPVFANYTLAFALQLRKKLKADAKNRWRK
jgi:hypothetical protein